MSFQAHTYGIAHDLSLQPDFSTAFLIKETMDDPMHAARL
jgi:hypothetical protein